MVALLDELGLDQVELIGHDWGGYTGFLLCLDEPERIRHYLALGIVHPWFEPPKPSPQACSGPPTSSSSPRPGSAPASFATPWLRQAGAHRGARTPSMRWSEEELDCYAQSFRSRDHALASSHVYRSFLTARAAAAEKGPLPLQRSPVPTRILAGEADR